MLGKLFKYEWKTASKLLLAVHGCVLLFAVLSRIFLEVSGGLDFILSANNENNIISLISGIIIFAIMVFVCCTALFTFIYIAYRFYKNVFTDQGYLTNTLPVTPAQIIVSKGSVAILWIIIDVILLVISCCIIFIKPSFIPEFLGALAEVANAEYMQYLSFYLWILFIYIILSPFIMIMHLYFSVAVGNLVQNHKILGAIGAYFASYTVIQIISTAIVAFSGYLNSAAVDYSNYTTAEITRHFASVLNPILISSLVLSVIVILFFWFTTKYIMTKKLNLQ